MKKILATILAAALGLGAWGADVAQNATTGVKYETLQEAINAASAGDTVQLLADVDMRSYFSTSSTRFPISKSLTIDGQNHSITVGGRGFGVGMNASTKIDVTFKDVTIANSSSGARCIDTRGNLNSLTLDHATLDTNGGSGYTQPLTIGGNQSDAATVSIVNGSKIQTNGEGTAYYAIITFNPVNMTIDDSTIKGWACIYAKGPDSSAGSAGSVFTITDSELVSKNVYSGESNAFAMLMAEDDNVTFNVTNTKIDVNATGDQSQAIVSTGSGSQTDVAANLGEGNEVTLSGNATFESNTGSAVVSGGTFNVAVPEEACADGFIPAAKDPNTGLYTVKEGTYVAQNATTGTKYETLQEAINAASAGDTVQLLADVDMRSYFSTSSTRFPISKSLTIDGQNHSITVGGRGFGVGMNASTKIDVTFKDVTIANSSSGARCIDTRGNLNSLTLNHVTLDTNGGSGYTQPLTIGGNQSEKATVSIVNGSKIQTNDEGKEYYAIITFNPVNMTIDDSTIKGWACIYAKGPDGSAGSAGSVFTITDSELVSKNVWPGTSNAFAMLMAEDDDVTFNVTNTKIDVNATGDQPQAIVATSGSQTDVAANLGEGNEVTLSGNATFESNTGSAVVSGGTFNVAVPEEVCADGYIPAAADPETGLYTVKQGTYVAQIGETKYISLAEAIAAANEAGTATITMIADSVETAGSTLAAGKSVVLDLNGKAVSYESDFPAAFNLIAVNGNLTVTDTSADADGSIALVSTANLSWNYAVNMFLVGSGGSLTIEKGSYSVTTPSYGYAEYVIAASNNSGASTVVVNGGTFTGNNIDAVVRLHDQYGRSQPLNVTVNGGDFTLNGSQCDSVIWFDVQNSNSGTDNASVANLVINGGTFTSASASPALDFGHDVDSSGLRVTVAGGAFKSNGAVIKTRNLSAAAIANIQLSGGIYSGNEYYNDLTKETASLDGLCVAGCKVAANTDAETNGNYPYVVGLLKVTDLAQQAGATETSATYVVTVVVVNDKGETIGTLPDQLTIEVSIAAADVAGSTLAKYDVSKVLDAALASGGLSVTKVGISVVISAPTSGDGTVSYEVHPEAVVTVTQDATDTTTTIPLSNVCLAADASFTFDLDVTGVVAAGDWAKVTHESADPKYAAEVRNLKAVAGDGGKVYVTVTTTHFSTFTIGAGVPPVTFGVRSDNLFGSVKIEGNIASNLYVAVPFEGFEAAGAARAASNVVHAANLSDGAKMFAWDKDTNGGQYNVYESEGGKWTTPPKVTVTADGKAVVSEADLGYGVAAGTGVILERKNTNETVYVYGQVPMSLAESVTFAAGQTLISPPYTNATVTVGGVKYVDMNAFEWTGVASAQTKRLRTTGADYIQFRDQNNKQIRYFYLEDGGWGLAPTQARMYPDYVADGKALVPVGTAFWYWSKSGGAEVTW